MNIFKKLGFRKDGREAKRQLNIVNTASKITWLFYTFTLLSWGTVELIQNGPTSLFQILMIILSAGITVFWSIYIYLNYIKKTSGQYKK